MVSDLLLLTDGSSHLKLTDNSSRLALLTTHASPVAPRVSLASNHAGIRLTLGTTTTTI